MTEQAEEPLEGGWLSDVVRVGDTVRRTAGPWTPAVHALLDHLHARGVARVPRPLGFDERGREVLGYVDGDVVGHAGPHTDDAMLWAVGSWLRDVHDASLTFSPPPTPHWQRTVGAPGDGEVMCHNDAAPWNCVVGPDGGLSFVDWDLAAPGPRVWDLGYVVRWWLPCSPDQSCAEMGWVVPPDRGARLRALLAGYRADAAVRAGVVEAVADRLHSIRRTIRQWGAIERRPGWVQLAEWAGPNRDEIDLAWLEANAATLHAAATAR